MHGLQTELIPQSPGSNGQADVRHIVTRDQLAAILDLAPVTVNKLANEGMPRHSHGRYDLAVCVQWYVATWRRRVDEAKAGSGDTSERKRYDAARAEAAELNLQQRRGELIPADTVRRVLTDVVGLMTSRLDALPARVAPQVAVEHDPSTVQELLLAEVHDVRSAISHAIRDYRPSAPRRRSGGASTTKKRRAVGRRKTPAPAG